jgi:hypothetical protein
MPIQIRGLCPKRFQRNLTKATCLEENSMMGLSWMRVAFLALFALTAVTLSGCGETGAKGPEGKKSAAPVTEDVCAVAGWCTEHRVPEDICAQCNAKVAAEFQKKGDWCKEHNRPKTQCFLCDPKLEAKFVADYEAKYGKKPPKSESRKP